MKKIKEILKDIFRNYTIVLVLGIIGTILLGVYKDEMELEWFIISLLLVCGGSVACIIYGVIKYFKDE